MSKLIIKKFVIISDTEMSANEFVFDNDINVYIGENKSGKSSLAKSILYTFGCDSIFENTWKDLSKIYLLFFRFNNIDYCIKRMNVVNKYHAQLGSNLFDLFVLNTDNEVEGFHKFSKVKEMAVFLNELFGFKIKLLIRKNLEISQIYPNHMFLLNYIDQDTSWGNLLTDTFNRQSFLLDYKNSILDYFLGYRTNEYYDISNTIKAIQKRLNEASNDNRSLEKLYNINLKKINEVENLDVESFKHTLEILNNEISKLLKKESKLKVRLSNYIYEKNKLVLINKDIERDLEKNKDELSNVCPVCGVEKRITNEKLFSITSNMYEVRREREMNLARLNKLESLISETKLEINNLSSEEESLKASLKRGRERMDLTESIRNFGIVEISKELESEIVENITKIDSLKKEIQIEKQKLDRLEKNENLIRNYNSELRRIFKKLKVDYKYKNDQNNFLRFSTSYSGSDRVSAIIGFYITVNKFISYNIDVPTFPFILDTLYKEDFDNENEINLIDVYFNEMTSVNQQQFLFTSNRDTVIEYLIANKIDYKIITGKRKLLDEEKYLEIKNKYAKYGL